MIVGQEKATNGSIYINGRKYETFLDGICPDIGYCPQFNSTQDKFTLEDHLYLFARLRGIRHHSIEATIEIISNLFSLDSYLKQDVKQLSGGTIRRMHAAIALIGTPNVLLLGWLILSS